MAVTPKPPPPLTTVQKLTVQEAAVRWYQAHLADSAAHAAWLAAGATRGTAHNRAEEQRVQLAKVWKASGMSGTQVQLVAPGIGIVLTYGFDALNDPQIVELPKAAPVPPRQPGDDDDR